MKNFILIDLNKERGFFLPLTFTRPISEILFGILTIKEKWEKSLRSEISYKTEEYLSEKYNIKITGQDVYINSSVCPNEILVERIQNLKRGESIEKKGKVLAYYPNEKGDIVDKIEEKEDILDINNIWDIFKKNDIAIECDFKILTKGEKTHKLSETNAILGEKENIFLEEGVKIEYSILNVGNGFMYFRKNSEVMEGSMIKGSFSMGENSVVKMGAKIYGATTVGNYSKVGGEINNSVIFSYSNKSHDGFLGNSILGEWCNLGADTNSSNLKNNYSNISIWDYNKRAFEKTTEQFIGLIMGDHSKSGINTMFNTGTIIGCFCNIFGSDFPQKYISNFSWGNKNIDLYKIEEALETSSIVMKRRNIEISEKDINIYRYIFNNLR